MSHGFRGPHYSLTAAFDKRGLREAGLAVRARVAPGTASAFAKRLARLGPDLARAQSAAVVAVFSSIGDEVATEPLMHALQEAGFAVCLPVTGIRGTRLIFRRWTSGDEMVAGRLGILEPFTSAELLEPDLVFVPVAAFDRRGHRLGYGAGFYDLTLAALRAEKAVVAIGVAYAGQEVLFIPNEAHDEPLDLVVTDSETIACTGTT